MRNVVSRTGSMLVVLVLFAMMMTVNAQEQEMTQPLDLSSEHIVLDFSAQAAGPPTIEPLADGRILFKINGEGPVSGSLEGTMRSAITEVNPHQSPVQQSVSISFTIETEQGVLEGYYAGAIHHPIDGELAYINAHGFILSVTGAYADLFMADVYVTSEVLFVDGRSTGETGTITIAPR